MTRLFFHYKYFNVITVLVPIYLFECLLSQIQQKDLEAEITRRSLTHTSWDISNSKDHERRGWHPVTYKYSDATPMLLKFIKVSSLLPLQNLPFESTSIHDHFHAS